MPESAIADCVFLLQGHESPLQVIMLLMAEQLKCRVHLIDEHMSSRVDHFTKNEAHALFLVLWCAAAAAQPTGHT